MLLGRAGGPTARSTPPTMHRMGERGSRRPGTAWLAALLWAAPGVHQPRLFIEPTTSRRLGPSTLVAGNHIHHSWDVRDRGWSREANMPHIGPVLEGRTFFCPHCGALYSATPSLVPKSEGDAPKCVVCLKVMDSLDTTKVPSFKLIQRPEDA